ncbi:alpha-amylase family glycosyl hydrolase [Granulicella sp. dw_53]|uniref:alpha-amylase family glycosyl hydrolase n=1 Tax=Granulicella sp. dw_53 TaxID=2719792 RepID=UPI001BD36CAF|nr:alpha-amylase family glycosyl hydrolase [Granulicella sp. dw_53]
MKTSARLWWQDGAIYQIYPRSFQDSNGDGIGDLPGILSRIDYLATLGVEAVWISPFYPSPMADFGYDVADYCNVDPIFGTLPDFIRLIDALHTRGLRVILDFVPNHSSDQHPWFLESKISRDNPKQDWYLWRDPAPGAGVPESRPPNNWQSHFGGPAWTYNPERGQFYYHSFLRQQPDLNWRNPEVRKAIYAAMRFWLDRGVDGFRMDVLWLLIKDDQFRDNPLNPDWSGGGSSFGRVLPLYTADRPETHEVVAEMRAVMASYPNRDAVLIGEIYLPLRDLVAYYGFDPNTADLRGADMPFNFHLIQTPWNADRIAQLIREYEGQLPTGAWPNWVLGNHDQTRIATRLGEYQARVAAMLLLTLRGTPTLYYGDELGMTDGSIHPDQVRDPAELNQPGIGMGRDPERTPMLWDNSPVAGFTSGQPWLPVNEGAATRNVAAQSSPDAPRSILNLYRKLLALRRQHPALHAGAISYVQSNSGVLSYRRILGDQQFQIFLNLTDDIKRVTSEPGHILLTTILDGEGADVGGITILEAGEGLLIALKNPHIPDPPNKP